MKPLLDVFRDYHRDERDWLICGKGPSFSKLSSHDISGYNTLSLNHVVRSLPVDVAHVIDLDVIQQLGEKLYENSKVCFMPYYPHLGWRPNPNITLDELSQNNPILKRLREEGRLYGYNLSTASLSFNKVWNDSPIVWASFFSAEAAVSLLGRLGVKTIKTLGVDGGIGQSSSFSDLQNINIKGYDNQWNGIRKSIKKYGLNYAPLGVESPIRIFVGAGEQQLVPALVLKHSILKHATMSVDVTIMNEWKHPMPKDARNWPRTPFSFQRFMIPEKCGYKGHAIYMDSDMLVFGDVKEVWQMSGEPIIAMRNDDVDKHKAKFSVIRIDCKEARIEMQRLIDLIDKGMMTYEELVFHFDIGLDIESGANPDWNSLEEYTEGKTKLLHYTFMGTQPWWANPDHPLGHLWFSELKEAVTDGSIDRNLIEEHVVKKWILPKCLEVL